LRTLARRSPVPVELDITADTRLPEPIEVAAYHVASEALANATKHAQASRVDVSLATRNRSLLLSIRDNGVGGADPARGSGLVGLTDRVEALGGSSVSAVGRGWDADHRGAATRAGAGGRTLSNALVWSRQARTRVTDLGPSLSWLPTAGPGG
jgi:hypothetical protein